ncbi:RNA polymerase sigma factor [Oricola sp.]|uniref:RNA polymerase sigma factor n=1 Tax=Oricola sp. TaxID=1979950 RepID=UPI0025D1CB60|nr:RNA polymerase sigma factor [Oricola sp.]MCI5074774.1 RNA polymerase sigma factor [Oricola sp.]
MSRFETDVLAVLPRLKRYARSLARDASDADDLVQDCLEKAFARRASWRGDNLQSWLMTILTNLNRNRLRKAGTTPAMVDIDDAQAVESGQASADPLERDRIVAALDRLHPDQRAVLMLVVVEGYAYGEVAEMLDIPLGTVMSRLSRARRMLATILEGHNIVAFRRTP